MNQANFWLIKFLIYSLVGTVQANTCEASHHGKQLSVAPAFYPPYLKECGSCHFAYPPGLLPSTSWQAILADLGNHFGDDAEVDEDMQQDLTRYLVTNAADYVAIYPLSIHILQSLSGYKKPPLRITDTPYISYRHWQIPFSRIENNPKVKSLSHCNKCHQHAEDGVFKRHDVSIPGYGRVNHHF
jgi:hypothetical protein